MAGMPGIASCKPRGRTALRAGVQARGPRNLRRSPWGAQEVTHTISARQLSPLKFRPYLLSKTTNTATPLLDCSCYCKVLLWSFYKDKKAKLVKHVWYADSEAVGWWLWEEGRELRSWELDTAFTCIFSREFISLCIGPCAPCLRMCTCESIDFQLEL